MSQCRQITELKLMRGKYRQHLRAETKLEPPVGYYPDCRTDQTSDRRLKSLQEMFATVAGDVLRVPTDIQAGRQAGAQQ